MWCEQISPDFAISELHIYIDYIISVPTISSWYLLTLASSCPSISKLGTIFLISRQKPNNFISVRY